MPTFDEIRKQIEADIATKQTEPVTVAGKIVPDVDVKGMPTPTQAVVKGTIVARPGTEKVTFDTPSFQLMECTSAASGYPKPRYCFVEKGVKPMYGNQFMNSEGNRVHIITKELYVVLSGILNSVRKQIKDLTTELTLTKEQRDAARMTIDALRKNGVID
jgi:glycerol kinase